MPIKNRHSIRALGAVAAAANSGIETMDEATRALIHIEGSGAVVTIEASPDDGTTWAPLYENIDAAPEIWTRTVPAAGGCYTIPFMPKTYRVLVATADATGIYVEGLRDF